MMTIIEPSLNTPNVIASIRALEKTLGLTQQDITTALEIPESKKYHVKQVPKQNGELRSVYRPHPLIRRAQRRINNNIFKKIVLWPSYIFGSLPNTINKNNEVERKDYISCAAQHCGAKSLLKMDIKDFFDNIHIDHVRSMFIHFFKCGDDVADILAKLCCKENHVVQGGLTSSYIACLILWNIEHKLVNRLARKNLTYTRLMDDITVSSKISNFDFSMTTNLIANMLQELDLPINTSKTKVCHLSTEPLTVHGVRVNFKEPRFPSNEVKRIRASVHNLTILASQPGYRLTHDYRSDYARCMGRVNKLKRVNHEKHKEFLVILQKILPLPSVRDKKRAKQMFIRLIKDYRIKYKTKGYRTRYFRLQERLNVLSRKKDYLNFTKYIRKKLKNIKPDEHSKTDF
ncbi:reverse transcriptase family protein [Shewanella algae]|uniref:reverse transcriptase family protein n=1 Tax=Shewanella algae TaxID=38313 RepID=UPI00055C087E|nr:reverse transcriptase family protein [Shewanella algae]